MATDGTSWADQWGAGGIGAVDQEDDESSTKTAADTKKKAAAGLNKVKAAASASAQKIKTGTTNGFKWIKTLSHKKTSTTSPPPDQ